MQKPALTTYPIHDLLNQRWSPRAFSEQTISQEQLGSLLEAARWAPSAFNEQPWRFVVGTRENPEAFARLQSCLMKGNQTWAPNASVLILAVAKGLFSHKDRPNRHAAYDVGQAVANLTVEATNQGLYVHQMAGFYKDKARGVFNIPEEYEPMTMIAIGFLGNLETLPENLQARETNPRHRKPLSELVFTETWGQAADF